MQMAPRESEFDSRTILSDSDSGDNVGDSRRQKLPNRRPVEHAISTSDSDESPPKQHYGRDSCPTSKVRSASVEERCRDTVLASQAKTDKDLILWLNSQTFPSALLCNEVADLRSGQIIHDCMSVFLSQVNPASLTVASSHPVPPTNRIAATLDALLAFFGDNAEITAQESIHDIFEHLPILRQALLRDSAIPLQTEWVDDLLIWMLEVFRFVDRGGSFPDTSRLACLAKAACAASGSRDEASADPTNGHTPAQAWAYPRGIPHAGIPETTTQRLRLSSAREQAEGERARSLNRTSTRGDRAVSPLHSGRPSALPVTPRARRRRSPVPRARGGGGGGDSRGMEGSGVKGGTAAQLPSGSPSKRTGPSRGKLSVAQLRIVKWLENLGVEMARRPDDESQGQGGEGGEGGRGGGRRQKMLREEDVVASLCDGVQLCRAVGRLEGVVMNNLLQGSKARTRAAKVSNLEKMLVLLRDARRSMPSRWLWSAADIADQKAEALWGLCADLYTEYSGADADAQHPLSFDAFLDAHLSPPPPPLLHTDAAPGHAVSCAAAGAPGSARSGLGVCSSSAFGGWLGEPSASSGQLQLQPLQRFQDACAPSPDMAADSLRLSSDALGKTGSGAASGPDPGMRRWLWQLGVAIGGADGAGGGGTDDGGALPLSAQHFRATLDRGLSLLDDPHRNGQVVWEVSVALAALQVQRQEQLAALREGRKPRRCPRNPRMFRMPFRRPKTVGEGRANMEQALVLLRGCGVVVSPALAHNGVLEAILQGDESALWSLLSAMRTAAAALDAPAESAPFAMMSVIADESKARRAAAVAAAAGKVGKGGGAAVAEVAEGVLAYRRRDVALLEVAVMQWMLTLPLLPDSLETLTRVVMQVQPRGVAVSVPRVEILRSVLHRLGCG
jgi:hypothetical protein